MKLYFEKKIKFKKDTITQKNRESEIEIEIERNKIIEIYCILKNLYT